MHEWSLGNIESLLESPGSRVTFWEFLESIKLPKGGLGLSPLHLLT